jgi:hypothetical protein
MGNLPTDTRAFHREARRDGRSLVAVAFSPSGVAVVHSRAGRKIQKLLELPPIPAPPPNCFAGCEAQHQQTTFAKKKSHDAMFFVNTAPRASADPGSPPDCFAGCEAQHQQTTFAKKKSHDAMFFVNTAPRASADPGFAYSEGTVDSFTARRCVAPIRRRRSSRRRRRGSRSG